MKRKVVITSAGIVSSLGNSLEEISRNIKTGNVSFSNSFASQDSIVSPIAGFDLRHYIGQFKDRKYLNRGAQLGVAAAFLAVKNSGLKPDQIGQAGIFAGTGPNLDIGGEFPEIRDSDIDRQDLMALWILKFLPNTAVSSIAKLTGIHGENLTISTACSASLQAIGEAFRKIRDGYLECAFAGGFDSRLSRGGLLAYSKAHAICLLNIDPLKASMPFDKKRQGFVPGEGAAFFLLEELEHAKQRGATIYGEICGFGSSLDGYNMTAPDPGAEWGEKAVRYALKDAGMDPECIDVVSTHGTGTLLNDISEANLIERLFIKKSPLVIALKSWIGHIASACGALELGICLSCMKNNYLPQIRNLDTPCHPGLNFVLQGFDHVFETVMLQNFGFGGQNSALVLRKHSPNALGTDDNEKQDCH